MVIFLLLINVDKGEGRKLAPLLDATCRGPRDTDPLLDL